MSPTVNLRKLTLKELKVLAGQKLGELAAKLKTKDDLIAALEKLSPRAAGVVKPKLTKVTAAEVKPAPVPKPKIGEPKVAKPPEPKVVRPTAVAKKAPRVTVEPVRAASAPTPGPSGHPLPEREGSGSRSLTVTQDFFVMPGTARLPAAHGDDRVLAFPRDTGGVYVSWDFSLPTWGHGPATLEVVEGDEVLAEVPIDAPYGGRFIDVRAGSPVFVAVRRGAMLLGKSPFLSLPPGKAGRAERKRLSVRWSDPLPTRAVPVRSNRGFRAATATRLERADASSDVRRIDEESWDTSDVTSRMA